MKKVRSILFVVLLLSIIVLPVLATYSNGPNNKNYDRSAAADYVAEYTLSANPDYANYSNLGGDCTNFASQALVAGGMAMTEAVSNPSNSTSWYYYYDSNPGLGRTSSWTGAHEFRQYWADVNGSGGKHAYEFKKYTVSEFKNDNDVWYEIYSYLEPGDIVQYVSASTGNTYHTQIVHRTAYENGEYKVSMGQHSPFSWASLRTFAKAQGDSTIVCLLKIQNPRYSTASRSGGLASMTIDELAALLDELSDLHPDTEEAEHQKWADIAAVKNELVDRAIKSGYEYTEQVTFDTLYEFMETRLVMNEKIIYAEITIQGEEAAEPTVTAVRQESERIEAFRETLPQSGDDAYSYWQYYWDEVLHETAPSEYIP